MTMTSLVVVVAPLIKKLKNFKILKKEKDKIIIKNLYSG